MVTVTVTPHLRGTSKASQDRGVDAGDHSTTVASPMDRARSLTRDSELERRRRHRGPGIYRRSTAHPRIESRSLSGGSSCELHGNAASESGRRGRRSWPGGHSRTARVPLAAAATVADADRRFRLAECGQSGKMVP